MSSATRPAVTDLADLGGMAGRIAHLGRPARLLSLGAGVQSTTLALAAVDGLIPPVDVAVFADTGWEPAAVYAHLARLGDALAEADVPLLIVSHGNIRDDALSPGHRFASMPLHTQEDPTPESDGKGMVRRQCTSEYKLRPIKEAARALLGAEVGGKGDGRVKVGRVKRGRWLYNVVGISTDEVLRVKPSDVGYLRRTDPLIDVLGWSRSQCIAWLAERWDAPVARSACLGCPFHSNAEWRAIRDDDPRGWADVVEFDAAIRGGNRRLNMPHLRGKAYLHPDRVPLSEADIDRVTAHERRKTAPSLFDGLDPFGCSPYGCHRSDEGAIFDPDDREAS